MIVHLGTYYNVSNKTTIAVAIKVLFTDDQDEAEVIAKLREEADLLYDLRHRNIIPLIGGI